VDERGTCGWCGEVGEWCSRCRGCEQHGCIINGVCIICQDRHQCKTSDGTVIEIGLRVVDYDGKPGVVVEKPHDYEFIDSVCWPMAGHHGHWWYTCPDREGHTHGEDCRAVGHFDGSRLTTKGAV
jgi:hypothetical protein